MFGFDISEMKLIEYLTIYWTKTLIYVPPICNFEMNWESDIWLRNDHNEFYFLYHCNSYFWS